MQNDIYAKKMGGIGGIWVKWGAHHQGWRARHDERRGRHYRSLIGVGIDSENTGKNEWWEHDDVPEIDMVGGTDERSTILYRKGKDRKTVQLPQTSETGRDNIKKKLLREKIPTEL